MKIHIPAFVAMVAMTAVTAFGQYRQQAPQHHQGPQPQQAQQAPMYQQAPQYQQAPRQQQTQQQYQQPQQNWRTPIVQASTLRTPKTPTSPQPMQQGNYSSVVEGCGSDCGAGSCGDQYCNCDSQCGSGAGCGSQCGGGKCGSGCGGLGERLRSRGGNRGGRRNQNQCDDYNPCCPQDYVSIFAGGATFNDIDYHLGFTDPGGATSDLNAVLNQNNGWTIGAAIGRRIRRRVRAEFEVAYRNATFEEGSILVDGVNNGTASLDGQLNEYRSTTNLLFDLNPGGRFNAYFGGGLGVGFFDLDAQEQTVPIAARLESSSWIYQGIFGISAKINQRASVFFDYRYSGTDSLEFAAVSPAGALDTNVSITSNNFIVGIRINR